MQNELAVLPLNKLLKDFEGCIETIFKSRAKNRLLLRVKATKYREENKEKKNNTWKLARRKQRENETIEQREIRLAKRRLYRSSK